LDLGRGREGKERARRGREGGRKRKRWEEIEREGIREGRVGRGQGKPPPEQKF